MKYGTIATAIGVGTSAFGVSASSVDAIEKNADLEAKIYKWPRPTGTRPGDWVMPGIFVPTSNTQLRDDLVLRQSPFERTRDALLAMRQTPLHYLQDESVPEPRDAVWDKVFAVCAALHKEVLIPQSNLGGDGNVELMWKTEKGYLVVDFRDDESVTFYHSSLQAEPIAFAEERGIETAQRQLQMRLQEI